MGPDHQGRGHQSRLAHRALCISKIRSRVSSERDQSGRAPDILTTFDHLSISVLRYRAKCSGLPAAGSNPCSRNQRCPSGLSIMATISPFSLLTTGCGRNQGDGREIGDCIVLRLLIEAHIDRMRRWHKHDRVAVGRCFRDDCGARHAAGSRPVVDDDGLTPGARQSLAHGARENIVRTPWRKRDDKTNGPLRIGRIGTHLLCASRLHPERDDEAEQQQQIA